MESVQDILRVLVRRFGVLNASCCDECCGEQVSMAQSHILFEIRRMGNASMQRVAEELGMDVTTFSRQVKSLEGKGLVERQVAPEDRRVSLLELTGSGKAVLERIDRYLAEKVELIFTDMTPFERETVVRSVGLLNEALFKTGYCGPQPGEKIACCN